MAYKFFRVCNGEIVAWWWDMLWTWVTRGEISKTDQGRVGGVIWVHLL